MDFVSYGEKNGRGIGKTLNIAASGADKMVKMQNGVNLVFPHQLYSDNPLIKNGFEFYLIEEYLFFKQYKFHKQKLAFHRASMKAYGTYLEQSGAKITYIEADDLLSDIRNFDQELVRRGITHIHLIDPTDDWLECRLKKMTDDIELTIHRSLQFLNSREELQPFFRSDKKSFFQTTFYKQQRKKRHILIENDQEPTGGKWTYDSENRKKYPRGKVPPAIHFPDDSDYWDEAVRYVEKTFPNNPGSLSNERYYPITHNEAKEWLEQFLIYRFFEFGSYEDAIVKEFLVLHHSLLSPLMNVGLLPPDLIVERALTFAEDEHIPINSTEGFIRQIIGWREFIRGMYECKGRYTRTCNFWNFNRKIPPSFYTGTTGIEPIDQTIKKVLRTGYCHHIERLMILGNFMLLCEFDPDEVYRWFMELFIDAYDWVMVPNVYGMSLFADGGTFATKPYISGSNYIKKMSNYKKGEWEKVWDGMFWRFIDKQQEFFLANPRMSMMVHTYNRMSEEKRSSHLQHAQSFIENSLNFQ